MPVSFLNRLRYLRDARVSKNYLDRLPRDYYARTLLRELLKEEMPPESVNRMSDDEVRRALAALVAFGPVRISEGPYRTSAMIIGGDKPNRPPDIPGPGGGGGIAPPKKVKHWVDFKVVWQEAGQPIAGATVKYRYIKGGKNVEEEKVANAQGIIQVEDIGDEANTVEILEIKLKEETTEVLMVKSFSSRAPDTPNT